MKVNKKGVGGTKGRPKSEFFSFLRSVCYSIVKLCPLPAHCYSPPPETQHSWSRPFATKEIKQLGITKGWGRSPTWRKELIFGKPPTKALRCEWLGAEDQKESDKESCKACKCSPPSAAVAETALAPQWRMPCSYVFPVDCEGTVYLCLSKHYETLFSFPIQNWTAVQSKFTFVLFLPSTNWDQGIKEKHSRRCCWGREIFH